jgi:ATP-dependent RNA helicase DeaD
VGKNYYPFREIWDLMNDAGIGEIKTLSFDDLPFSEEIRKAIADMGFEEPTPIQSLAIPPILEGKDVVGQAYTGTGKTAAFGIPALELVDPTDPRVQVIVLCPTRELAIQVAEELSRLSRHKTGIRIVPIYGGQPIERQLSALQRGVHIVIGTPGRVMDHMRRRTLSLGQIRMVVLDEADEMLDMGFRDDIETILADVPKKRQTVLFSATMSQEILDLAKRYLQKPMMVKVVHRQLTVPSTEQVYFEVHEGMKLELLSRLIDIHDLQLSLVFCNTKRKVDEVVSQLKARGYPAEGLHGDMNQAQRERVMGRFRTGGIEILVATDVAARGIDVENIEAVFNYDVPQDEEYYVHRIGRTGRAGKAGKAFTFVSGREIYKLRDIQRYANVRIAQQKLPSVADVAESRENQVLDRVREVLQEDDLGRYAQMVERLLREDHTSLDVAAALLKMRLSAESGASDIRDEDLENTGAEPGMARLFVNVGRSHGVRAKDIVGAIAGETGMPGKRIGAIDIFDSYTFVEVPKELAREVLTIMDGNQIKGKSIHIEPASKRQSSR